MAKGLTSKQMSSMYKKARKVGYSKKKAFSTVGLAKRLSKSTRKGPQKRLKRQHPWLDFDGDHVVNKYDCQPRNKWKQDKTYPRDVEYYSHGEWDEDDNNMQPVVRNVTVADKQEERMIRKAFKSPGNYYYGEIIGTEPAHHRYYEEDDGRVIQSGITKAGATQGKKNTTRLMRRLSL